MSEFLAAAAAVLNAPEELVLRSAEAKADALGGTADDYLAAWGGGEAAPAPPVTAVAAPAEAPPVVESAPEPAVPKAVPMPTAAPMAVPVQPVVQAAVVEEEPPPPVDPAPLRVRRKLGGRLGTVTGAAIGLVSLVALSPWLAARADTLGEEGPFSPSLIMTPNWVTIGLVVLFGVYGMILALFTTEAVGWHGPGMRIVEGRGSILVGGMLTGFVVGGAAGAVTTGMFGTVIPGAEEVEVSVVAGLAVVVVAGAALGWAVGQLSQILGVPEGMTGAEGEEATVVRFRLKSALALPVIGLVLIAMLVLPNAYVFLQFPSWAPIMGSIVAASILTFAGLAASRPGMRITRGEFLLAAAGIGVMVFILFAVLNTQGAGHSESEDDHGVEAEAIEVVVSS
ncbi:MAG: hypothetical protein OXC98_10010 [bacterium]|nr:hypothetical protein [Acidimicrobiia bacterium]MCY4650682.1 hypothetical protein [bacterium]